MKKLLLVVLFFGVAHVTRADTFSTFSITGTACDSMDVGPCNTSTTSASSLTVVSPEGLISVTAAADQVNIGYGSLFLSAFSNGTEGTVTPSFSTIMATIGFTDVVTIFGGVGQGQLSYAAQSFGNIDSENGRCGGGFGSNASIPTTFTFGVPFQIGAQVSVEGVGFICNATVSSSFTLTSLTATDSNGNPIPNLTFTDASQTDYPFVDGTFVPTPDVSTGLLLVAGLLLSVVFPRFRRH